MSLTLTITAAVLSAFAPRIQEQQLAAHTHAPRFVAGELSAPLTGDLPQAAKAWAWNERWRYGLPAHSTLVNGQSFNTRFGASFHLLQHVGDVEVYGARLVVTVDARARVVQVASSLVTSPSVIAQWNLSPDEALRRAAEGVPFAMLDQEGRPYGASKRFLFESNGELHAGYLVHVASAERSKNWYVLVDAVNGAVLATQNRVHLQSMQARAYPISPGGLDAGVGRTPTQAVELRHADGGSMVLPWSVNDGGFLNGTQLTTYNCCPTDNCEVDGGAARINGTLRVMGFNVAYNTVICQRRQRASNDPSVLGSGEFSGDAGSYLYTPVDPPQGASVQLTDPTNSDQFAEVHSFFHVNRVYDWVRGLSSRAQATFTQQPAIRPFAMRDEVAGRKPAVWANVTFPDIQAEITRVDGGISALIACVTAPALPDGGPGCRLQLNSLQRWDNAAFFPKETFAQIPVPGFDTGVDTLMIFQGNGGDAAYDATVLQHEFGHGVVYATAALTFDTLAFDEHAANNESGALHEGFADYVAAAFNNDPAVGPYFGPRAAASAGLAGVRQESYLRTLTNTNACPDVLWGEVHQDSQHVSAALWAGRQAFQGTDNGATYDAAFYAMLVSISPGADFAQAAAAMTNRVAEAFPGMANARAQMQGFFSSRGVTGCNKIMNAPLAMPRRSYGISAPPSSLRNQLVPGPIQFKLPAPNGARQIRFNGTIGGSNSLFGGSTPSVTGLASAAPITFNVTAGSVTNTATTTGVISNNTALGPLMVNFPCGANNFVYVTLGVTSGGATISNLQVEVDPLLSCTADAGTGMDGGMGGADAGPMTDTITQGYAGDPASLSPAAKEGCGCSAVELSPALGLALAAALRRRRGSRR